MNIEINYTMIGVYTFTFFIYLFLYTFDIKLYTSYRRAC